MPAPQVATCAEEERSDFLHALPAGIVVVRKRRPDDAARRGLGFLRRPGDGGCESGVGVVVDQAFPHRAVAGELDDLDVALLEIAERQDRQRILVQRRRADDEADALALELLDLRSRRCRARRRASRRCSRPRTAPVAGLAGPIPWRRIRTRLPARNRCRNPLPTTIARPARNGARRATSLPAGSTRTSVPYLSFIILPTATAMLNPAVPVS